MSKQSRKAAFAHRMRKNRIFKRIMKTHGHRPGFVGVVHSLSITDATGRVLPFKAGALFMESTPS